MGQSAGGLGDLCPLSFVGCDSVALPWRVQPRRMTYCNASVVVWSALSALLSSTAPSVVGRGSIAKIGQEGKQFTLLAPLFGAYSGHTCSRG